MNEQEQSTPTPAASGPEQFNPGPFAPRSSSAPSGAAPLLMGVKLPIRVLLGRTELCLRDIAQLGNGAVVELDCSPDDPVEIIVNDRVIAHGEVVVVAGNYGVRITKIASRGEIPEPEGGAADLSSLSDKLR
jgi:flagellar motor switch protein FliN/FliY